MTKQFLRSAVLIILSVYVFASCKKTHSLNPYPENARLLSFTKSTKYASGAPTLNEIYRFAYDTYNRVATITHTKDDGSQNLLTTFDYRNDTIYYKITYPNLSIVESGFYLTDKKGMISVTHEPAATTTYDYIGKLVTKRAYSNSNYFTFTSYNFNLTRKVSSIDAVNNEEYSYYTDKFNRTGDYIQLNSFLKYGFNFYQNDNLIWKIKKVTTNTSVDYEIDADNKITRTTALISDSAGHLNITETYDLQYENYR